MREVRYRDIGRLDTPEKLFKAIFRACGVEGTRQVLDILSRAEVRAWQNIINDWLDLPRVGDIGVPSRGELFARRIRKYARADRPVRRETNLWQDEVSPGQITN